MEFNDGIRSDAILSKYNKNVKFSNRVMKAFKRKHPTKKLVYEHHSSTDDSVMEMSVSKESDNSSQK